MKTNVISDWVDEETFFDHRRRNPSLTIVDKKWSKGSSPIMLVKYGTIIKEEHEKCFWVQHPSKMRCWHCKLTDCPNYSKFPKIKD